MRRRRIFPILWFASLALALVSAEAQAKPVSHARGKTKRSLAQDSVAPALSSAASEAKSIDESKLPLATLSLEKTSDRPYELGDSARYSIESSNLTATMRLAEDEYTKVKDAETGIRVSDGKIYFLKEGAFEIPARRVVDEAGKAIAMTQPVQVTVQEVSIGQGEKPEGLYGYLVFRFPRSWLYAGIAALALLLLGLIIFLVRWSVERKRRLPPVPVEPKPVFQVCIIRLDDTRKGSDWSELRFKKVAYQFSETLKEFISLTYALPAEESTTFEVLRLLEAEGMNELAKEVDKIFTVLDLVKFTDYSPSSAEMEAIFKDSKELIFRWKKDLVMYAPR